MPTDIGTHNSLLGPIGDHRPQHMTPLKGKRQKKRKRAERHKLGDNLTMSQHESLEAKTPPKPELQECLTLGFNTTTRYLESLAVQSIPQRIQSQDPNSTLKVNQGRSEGQPVNLQPLAAVFVPRSGQSSILHSHLPLLTQTASLALSSSPPTRLVILPKGAEDRLSSALAIPRVGLVGLIHDAPNAAPLIEFVRQHVPIVKVPLLQEASAGAYLPVEIKMIQTSAPVESKRSARTQVSTAATKD
ncbi:hypothetical protein MMC28_006041 [Mycoblastus sanguinarius]|nr:hypothetical protein [Mycoblastus sanguinarius]